MTIRYREPLFRPPAEAWSLIFQAAYGCPHNSCSFCGMYKSVSYRIRPEEELLREIETAGREHPAEKRVFLADGDIMALGFRRLEPILRKLNESFPRLARVSVYANGSSIARYSDEELTVLRKHKLHTLYLGLESGSQPLLDRVGKSEQVEEMIRSVRRAQACGLRASVMVLLGLGGKEYSREHAQASAEALNAMQPRLLSALRFVPVLGAPFERFELLSEEECVLELAQIVQELKLERTVFRANHASNVMPLEARFPADRERLLSDLKAALASGTLDSDGPGSFPLEL